MEENLHLVSYFTLWYTEKHTIRSLCTFHSFPEAIKLRIDGWNASAANWFQYVELSDIPHGTSIVMPLNSCVERVNACAGRNHTRISSIAVPMRNAAAVGQNTCHIHSKPQLKECSCWIWIYIFQVPIPKWFSLDNSITVYYFNDTGYVSEKSSLCVGYF